MKKLVTLLLVALMALSFAAPAMAEEPVTLVVASFYNTGSASGWDGLVAKFQEKYPHVNVEVQETTGDEYMTKLVSQLASGTAPDIIALENSSIARFVDNNLLMPLNDYFAKDTEVSLDEYMPHLLDRYTVDGNVYGLPYDAQPSGMFFFNKGLFDEAGLAYPDETWTWDDMLEAAIKLTKKDESGRVTQYGVMANTWQNYVYSAGGRIVDDIKNVTKCTMNSEEAKTGLQFMVDLVQTHGVMPSPETMDAGGASAEDMFATGQIAMLNAGYWSLVDLPNRWAEIDLGLTMWPMSPNGGRNVSTGGTAYCVANGSKNPDLAYEFVKYFMGAQGWEAAYEAAERGVIYPPAHIPSYEKLVLNNPEIPVENMDINRQLVECAIFAPLHPLYNEIESKVITPTIEEMLLGYTTVEDGLASIEQRFNDALESGEVF